MQGLGYVGAAMAIATANARDDNGAACFDVIGVERDDARGSARALALQTGRFPYATADTALEAAAADAHAYGNLSATTDPAAYELASVAVCDVHLDVIEDADGVRADTSVLEGAVRTLGERLPAGALVIVETTVPPGTCERLVAPILAAACRERGLAADAIALAHSYERVMPGPDYLRSITNFWRVYAGRDDAAAAACAAFLGRVVNVQDYPLRRLASMTASETAKVLENSYRAANIAFIDEWGRLAEAYGIDLFEVLDAVRDRPTHDNIRQPGFGVGGYCLTKDPLLPLASVRAFLPDVPLSFPFAELAVHINRAMPQANLARITALLDGSLVGRRLLLLGVAYRGEVDDTRYSPAEAFYRAAIAAGASVRCHDPLVRHWEELGIDIDPELPSAGTVDAVVLAVPHMAYRALDVVAWLGAAKPLVYDCDNVLSGAMRQALRAHGCRVESTGRGSGL
ncbi:MAG: nucleotide sugar dehydrogenase [Gammaproteobacteria bacterium]